MTPVQTFVVTIYRYLAIAALGAVLCSALAYAVVTLFYMANASWAAPVVISRTNEKILRLTAEVFRTRQAAHGLEHAWQSLARESQTLRAQAAVLEKLVSSSSRAATQQRHADLGLVPQLEQLSRAKRQDVARSHEVLTKIASLEATLDRDLRAGLITRDEAVRAQATFHTYKTSATDSAAAGVVLERQLSDLHRSAATLAGAPAQMPQALEVLSRAAFQQMQLDNLRLKLQHNELEIASKQKEAEQLYRIIATLSESPYFRATQAETPLSFAFVPYDNEDVARAGEPVYDCLLHMVLCTRIGRVARVHADEERAQHPLFKLETRGFLVELALDDAQAAKSRVLFVGRAPLLF